MIDGFDFAALSPLEKGWSGDRKYIAQGRDGRRYVLRVSPADKRERRAACFANMRRLWEAGVAMCEPVATGMCEDGVYTLLGFVEGEDAEAAVSALSPQAQYALGREAGEILARIHTIPAPPDLEPWDARFNRKIDRNIARFLECPIRAAGAEAFVSFIEANRALLAGRPQVWQHGDYHIGNMVLRPDGRLCVIDFDRDDFGDPWEEFNRIVWCAQKSPRFARGMVEGYFGGAVPETFWPLTALYIASNQLTSVAWAVPYGQKEIDVMLAQARCVLGWYDGMKNPVPVWARD